MWRRCRSLSAVVGVGVSMICQQGEIGRRWVAVVGGAKQLAAECLYRGELLKYARRSDASRWCPSSSLTRGFASVVAGASAQQKNRFDVITALAVSFPARPARGRQYRLRSSRVSARLNCCSIWAALQFEANQYRPASALLQGRRRRRSPFSPLSRQHYIQHTSTWWFAE